MSAKSSTPCALTIAGSDSGGGAGIQADLLTFAALGVYGCSVVTAVTAQNTQEVSGIWPVPGESVEQQIVAVLADIAVGAIKLGMLHNADIVRVVANQLVRHAMLPVVCDPVMVATSGDSLAASTMAHCLLELLVGRVTLLTPNIDEAATLLGCVPARDVAQMQAQARGLVELGAPAVLLTGGHLAGNEAVDVLARRTATGIESREFVCAKVQTQHSHGSGCTLSSAITAGLAKGLALVDAIAEAKTYTRSALEHAEILRIGHGRGPLHHFYRYWRP